MNKAMEMLDKAFYEICFSIDAMKGYHNETIELFNITDQYIKLHRKDKAALALSKCLEAIENIKERRTKATYLADIDAEYIKSGIDIGKAEKEILQEFFLKLQ